MFELVEAVDLVSQAKLWSWNQSFELLRTCLTSEGVTARENEQWEKVIRESTKASRSAVWVQRKVQLMGLAVEDNPVKEVSYGLEASLRSMLNLIQEFQLQLTELEKMIGSTAEVIPEVKLMETIPGVGSVLASSIVAELGDASQFTNPKQVVAFAGLDSSVFSSGNSWLVKTESPSEGKPHKVAVIACANKLIHHIYAMLKKGEPYAI